MIDKSHLLQSSHSLRGMEMHGRIVLFFLFVIHTVLVAFCLFGFLANTPYPKLIPNS
jgi:hypothetical protein